MSYTQGDDPALDAEVAAKREAVREQHRKLVEGVADLLCQKACTHPEFLIWLVDEMQRRGYTIEAHQRGIQGTYLCVARLTENNS